MTKKSLSPKTIFAPCYDCGFLVVGRRERIARLHGTWRDTVLTERRSAAVGAED